MPQLKSSSAREGTRQSSAGSGEGAASCRVPPHTCPPASGAVSSGLGFSPRCQRAPRLLAGAGVFPATLSPAAEARRASLPVSPGPPVSADFNVLPLWSGAASVVLRGLSPVGRTLGPTLSLSLAPWKPRQKSHSTPPTPGAPAGSLACFANDNVFDFSQGSGNFTVLKVLAYF